MSDLQVTHDAAARRFVARAAGDEVGHVAYQARGDTLDLLHTEIDPDAQGRGLGTRLVAATLDLVRDEGRRIVPTCPFVTDFLREHPEYRDLVADR